MKSRVKAYGRRRLLFFKAKTQVTVFFATGGCVLAAGGRLLEDDEWVPAVDR